VKEKEQAIKEEIYYRAIF